MSKILLDIVEENKEILETIREIYRVADNKKLRKLIEKHFIPTNQEKKQNAEIPTPVELVDEMLEKLPEKYWTKPHSTFEPCCGKGNFVLGIFDKFYQGLEKSIPNKKERCKKIVEECLYFGDLTQLNVFITTEILKCHIRNYLEEDISEDEYTFNSYVGDTLNVDIENTWGIDSFDAVIGNPPYNSYDEKTGKAKRGGDNNLYEKFIVKDLTLIRDNGYLVFVTPSSWFSISKKNQKLREKIFQYSVEYLNLGFAKKYFNRVGNNFVWFVICKSKPAKKHNIIVDCLYNKKEYNSEINQTLFSLPFIPLLLNESTMNILNKIISYEEEKIVAKLPYEYEPRKKYVLKEKPKSKDKEFVTIKTTKDNFLYSEKLIEGYDSYKLIIPSTKAYEKMEVTQYCTTQSFINIICEDEDEALNLKEILSLKVFRFMNNICRWGNWNYAEVISLFPKIDASSDKEVFKIFNLNKKEIELVETVF